MNIIKHRIFLFNIIVALGYNFWANWDSLHNVGHGLTVVFFLPCLVIVHVVILGIIRVFADNKNERLYTYSTISVFAIGVIGVVLPWVSYFNN